MRNILHLGVSIFAPLTFLASCAEGPKTIEPPVVPDSCGDVTNPLDSALCAELYESGYRPLLANDAELCDRLFIDMTGVRASPAELRDQCIGKRLDAVIEALQQTERYRHAQRRYWADRLSYSDSLVDPGSIRDLDALVDQLYQNQITYREFAIRAIAHPGFVGRHNGYGQPDLTAQAAFRAFLGRPATRPEALDLGNLWRSWSGTFFRGEDFARDAGAGVPAEDAARLPGGMGGAPYIDPTACEAGVNICESTLLGKATVAFPSNGRTDYIPVAELNDAQWEALRTPGRLFVSLDMFWEAEVDDMMKKLLGYDLGAMRPKVRQTLVDLFKRNDGDVRALERIILGSWVYRQTADEVDGSPRPEVLRESSLAYGPTKLMLAEGWLQSVGTVIGRSLGECDWRYPNLPDYQLPPETIAEFGDLYPHRPDGTIDPTFRDAARLVGGCPGAYDYGSASVTGRTNHIGLITAVAQEEALINVCFLGDVPALLPEGVSPSDRSVASIETTARHVLERIRLDPSAPDVAEVVDTVVADCSDCNVEDVARGLCSGLLGGIAFLTY